MSKWLILVLLLFSKMGATEFESCILPITEEIFQQMSYSWREDNPVPISDLRYITVSHWGFDDQVHQGCLIVHGKVAEEVVDIFKEIFEAQLFHIEKMRLVDLYEGLDERSAEDNNSYSFCSRSITGQPNVSKHSYGLAIDLNPLYNPYQRGSVLIPTNGAPYLDREQHTKGMIHPGGTCYEAFTKRGWKWGGDWQISRGYVDYHHFEKDPKEVL